MPLLATPSVLSDRNTGRVRRRTKFLFVPIIALALQVSRLHRDEETSLKPAPFASPPWSTPDFTQVGHGNGTPGFGEAV
jgi:hypothetical protein